MATGRRSDPYLAFNYKVEIEGIERAGFSEVTGLQVEVEVHDYREGGVNEYIHKLAGPTRYPSNLILKGGIIDSEQLWKWHKEVRTAKKGERFKRQNVSIVLQDSAGEELRRWNFQGAYPVRWTGPELRAGTAEVAVETLELAHHGLDPRR